MNKFKTLIILLLTAASIYSQDISGEWNGILKVQGMQLRLIFHISANDAGYTGTLDSPDQGAKGLPLSSVEFSDSSIIINADKLGLEYSGKLESEERINGTFKQAGQSFPLELTREVPEKEVIRRPQEPVKPYPYIEEEVRFAGGDSGVTLAGSLTFPQNGTKFPAVILITGSGQQNRNEELMGHKPFLVLADYLTRNGIAVLRYDDRGTAESTGEFKSATSLNFTYDVLSAIKYLKTRKEIESDKIGLIGHSEGGLIAPIAAVKSDDVSFIVLMAGPGTPGEKILLQQNEIIAKLSGMSEEKIKSQLENVKGVFDIVVNTENTDTLKTKLKHYINKRIDEHKIEVPASMNKEELISLQLSQLSSPWMKYFLSYDPAVNLRKVKCPVLAINGSKDVQVLPENLKIIESALNEGGNKNVTIKEFPGLNHLFQECSTGLMNEYSTIEQTISPEALREISGWIKNQIR